MIPLRPACRRALLILGATLLLAPPLPAQRVAPPPPAVYDVQINYRIRAGRNQRILQFLEMTRFLESIGFVRAPGADPNEAADPEAERMAGTLPSNRVRELLNESHVRTVLLSPQGSKPPDDPAQRVLVQIELARLAASAQRELHTQAVERLARLGFAEKYGYDHQNSTRVLGTIPAGELETLLKDLRGQPAGWLAPETPPDALPEPLRSVSPPLRVIEVLPEPDGVPPSAAAPPPAAPPAGQEFLAKIAPELTEAATAEGGNPIRMEVVLTHTPGPDERAWRDLLLARPGLTIEGRLGPVVAVVAAPGLARDLAALPEVASVRLPRAATRQPEPVPPKNATAVLTATGLDRLHRLNYRGAGVRVAIIDTNFAGVPERLGKELPKDTVLIDLTTTRNETILPDPPSEGGEIGRGTRLALAVRLAAPEAGLVLIRVDPAAAYMLLDTARYLYGEAFRSQSLENRYRELRADNERLNVLRERILQERREMAEDFSQDEEAVQRRRALAERTADLARQEQENLNRLTRYYKLEEDLINLRTVRVVVCPLAWDVGYPVDGSGPLSRYLDEVFYGRPVRRVPGSPVPRHGPPLWFQAAGNTRGQVWNGPLRDADGNGAFEFVPPGSLLPPGRWSPAVNFLAWQPTGADRAADLPAGARTRVALQWAEVHDPGVGAIVGPDPYRVPLANLSLMVLRQRDPSGTKVASDDFNVVARSAVLPQMIDRGRNWAVYESIVEFPVEAAGRYALHVVGSVPPTTRPADLPTLPALEKTWEPYARLFVDVSDPTTFGQGRLVFGDFMPGRGGLGMPGDAIIPRTVGAVDASGRPQPYSAFGASAGRDLLAKPRFLLYDELPLPGVPVGAGTEQATAFAGGMLAAMMSAGIPESADLNWLLLPPFGQLQVPPAWLDQVERRWPRTGRE